MDTILATAPGHRMNTKTFVKRRRFRPGRTHSSSSHQKTPVLSSESTKPVKGVLIPCFM